MTGLSIACVFNDPAVREQCLDRSLAAYSGPVDIDYLAVDNTTHAYPSAGAALNHAARQARHEVVVLVHQDVHLHSIDRLAAAAAALADRRWGLLGANGVASDGTGVGRLRDRVLLISDSAPEPVEVDSLDEVLFMARRDDLLEHPLTEHADLAWHAYAVEYGLRMRSMGRRVGAVDTAITHNSLTINLARLDEAHQRAGRLYPEHWPIHTTCGVIGNSGRTWWRSVPVLRDHAWRWSWLRRSARAARVRRRLAVPVALSDLNHEVDLLDFSAASPLHVINVDRQGGFAAHDSGGVELSRRTRGLVLSSVDTLDRVPALLSALPRDAHVVITGLVPDDLEAGLVDRLPGREWLVGLQWDEAWLLGGPNALDPPQGWRNQRWTG